NPSGRAKSGRPRLGTHGATPSQLGTDFSEDNRLPNEQFRNGGAMYSCSRCASMKPNRIKSRDIWTSPPCPLSIEWRGGQRQRSVAAAFLTPVPPLHRMERGPEAKIGGRCVPHPRAPSPSDGEGPRGKGKWSHPYCSPLFSRSNRWRGGRHQ